MLSKAGLSEKFPHIYICNESHFRGGDLGRVKRCPWPRAPSYLACVNSRSALLINLVLRPWNPEKAAEKREGGVLSGCAVIDGDGCRENEGQESDGIDGALNLRSPGGPVPQAPWDLSLWRCSSRRATESEPGSLGRDHPALLLFAASRRRSGRFPALPYPPLEQKEHFPFPFPGGSIERETGNGSLS
jgi:hypothetical protein